MTGNDQFIKPPPLAPSRFYDSPGRCIYCPEDAHTNILGDEHIIPEALGGTFVLRRASCKKHEGITSRAERFVLRDLLIQARTHLKLPTKRPKNRPTEFPVTVVVDDDTQRQMLVPADDCPITLGLLAFVNPRIFLDLPPDDSHPTGPAPLQSWFCVWYPKPGMSGGNYFGGKGHVADLKLGWGQFAKMLAKIGHAFATAELGHGNFRPLLLDIIHAPDGQFFGFSHLIGGECQPVAPGTELHEISLITHRTPKGQMLHVVRVRLFSYLGAPIYYAVAGTAV
ncbi:HNH endonuclease [Desertibaculum subflavum]|uniref:HNH endonuclease n=1 Tax=Desertibaculum subflavum TaxID=2268458 RepID=UPI000E66EF1D